MQVTDEMVQAARGSLAQVPLTDREIGKMLTAALAGYVPGPNATSGHELVPQLADVTPPAKVRAAAAAVPGIAFNLDQQYGGLDEAARKKMLQDLQFDVRDSTQSDDEPQATDG